MDYQLHCFRDSGFSYKVALLLNMLDVPWTPIYVEYKKGETRTESFRENINIQGECPVLDISPVQRLTQSAAIMQFLADQFDRFNGSETIDRYNILRWLSFDNHKFSSHLATHRYHHFVSPGALCSEVHKFIYAKTLNGLNIVEQQLARHRFVAGTQSLSIADISIAGYLLYPESEFDFSVSQTYPNISRLLNDIRSHSGFATPDQLFSGA